MRISLVLAFLGLAFGNNIFAQNARVRQFTAPLAGTAVLSETEDKYNAQVYNLEMPHPDAGTEAWKLKQIKKEVAAQFPRKAFKAPALKTTTAQMPLLSNNYVADSFPGIPPDNDMAISKGNKSVSVINSSIAVHNAQTGQMLYRRSLRQFSISVGLNNIIFDYRFDPKVIYDPVADRYICVMLNGTDDHNWIVLGFSQSNDPAATWKFYKFYGDFASDTTWFDYPSVAITENEFFLTGNQIKFNTSWQLGFKQTVIYQVKKKDGYDGAPSLSYQVWDSISYNGRNIRNLYPVKGGASIHGPEQYFLSNRNFDIQNDTVFLVKLPDTMGSGNTNLTVTPLVSNLTYGVPPQGRQPDTSVELATNDARVLGAYRVGDEIHFVSTTVHPTTGNAAVYHGKISDFSTSPVITANYYGVDTLDLGYPNISFAGNYSGANHSIISFNYTGATRFPGMGAAYFDGSQYSDMLDIKSGDSVIWQLQGKDQRWGDYMGSQPDWNASGVVWVEGIYGRADRDYGNYIARLVSPFATGITNPEKDRVHQLYPNPAFEMIRLEFELEQAGVLNFAIYDLQGRKLDQVLEQQCKAGRNRIQFNTASLPPGTYILQAQDRTGSTVMSSRFIRQ